MGMGFPQRELGVLRASGKDNESKLMNGAVPVTRTQGTEGVIDTHI